MNNNNGFDIFTIRIADTQYEQQMIIDNGNDTSSLFEFAICFYSIHNWMTSEITTNGEICNETSNQNESQPSDNLCDLLHYKENLWLIY